MKQILILFILFILGIPIETYAASENSSVLSIELKNTCHDFLVPGDTFTDTFMIKNLSSTPVKVRIYQVSNENNSKLFPVLQGRWETSKDRASFQSLENLTTDWFSINPKEHLVLPLELYFPSHLGNEYQNTKLNAKFLFVYQTSTNNNAKDPTSEIPILISHSASIASQTVPSTSDSHSKTFLYCGLCVCCGLSQFYLHIRKRKQGVFTHEP